MALQTRGFEVTNIPRAQGIDFSLQPGQFAAGLNSGIGAFNAFSNIAEEVRDRPLRQRERESRLAQIEAEAQMAPVRRQLTEIQLAKAGLPEDIVTSSTAVRVPRPEAPDQYDIVEQVEGFTFDPTSGQRTPFKRAGKLVSSAEQLADQNAMREVQRSQIQASLAKAADEKTYKDEIISLKKQQQAAKAEDLAYERAANADKAARAGLKYTEGERNGLKVGMFVHPVQGVVNEIPLGITPIRAPNPLAFLMGGETPPPAAVPAPITSAKPIPPATQARAINKVGIGVLDNIDENGNEIVAEDSVTTESPLPVIPATPLSTSGGKYKIVPR